MRLRTLLAGGAIACLALVSDLGGIIALPMMLHAEAATSVSISLFYNDLAGYGSWVNHRNSYVFIPSGVGAGWRPYTDGHWVYVEDVGWTWASNERFGWATYHYGRWGYDDEIGWYWIPGTRWAPAWVSWRRSNDYVVWAPLPPDRNDNVSISVSVGNVPDFYWVAVPTRSFLDVDLRVRLVDNDRDRERVIRNTRFIGTPRVQNNVVVNNVIDVKVIEKETGRKVRRLRAQETDNPREARATDDQVTVFRGEVKKDANAKPDRVQDESQVRKIRRNGNQDKKGTASGTSPSQPGTDQNQQDQTGTTGTTATEKTPTENQATSNTKKRQDQNQKPAATAQKRKKSTAGSDQNNNEANRKATDQRKSRPAQATGANQGRQNNKTAQQPSERKKAADQKKRNAGQQTQKAKPGAQPENAKKKRKQNCDPSTNANCAQQ